ncbi:hypothetical protein Bca52824_088524 [Brassica carinata]|uniref:Uncharacterized protein n=1 Tax=Brassica carinata TaxID=52824 RepID=A0A8X7TPN6_BRACI|nr:hypothetical protein Bca52824_088524 [Brassica carinata]
MFGSRLQCSHVRQQHQVAEISFENEASTNGNVSKFPASYNRDHSGFQIKEEAFSEIEWFVDNVEKDDQKCSDAIDRKVKSSEAPQKLVLNKMKSVLFQSKEHERDAEEVLDFGSAHTFFDKLTQRASNCIASPTSSDVTTATTLAPAVSPASLVYSDKASVKSMEMFTRDTFAAKVVEHENVYVGMRRRLHHQQRWST